MDEEVLQRNIRTVFELFETSWTNSSCSFKISRIELVKTVEIISGWDSSPSIHILSISFDMMWQFIWNQVDWFDRSKANGTKVDGLGFTVDSLDQNNLLLMIDRPENESGWGKVIWIPIRPDLERWYWRKNWPEYLDFIISWMMTVNTVMNALKRRIYVSVYQICKAGVKHKGRIIIFVTCFFKNLSELEVIRGHVRSHGIILESATPWTWNCKVLHVHLFVSCRADNHGNLM